MSAHPSSSDHTARAWRDATPGAEDLARSALELRSRVLGLLRLHGWNATSFQVLEPEFEYWFEGDDACVAYVDTGHAWVAAGAPIAPEPRLQEVAEKFSRAARENRRRAVFFATERRFARLPSFAAMLVGEQPIWNPKEWAANVRGTRSLREQLRRARAKGVSVVRLDPSELEKPNGNWRIAIEQLIERWMGSQPMPPMGFLVRVHPFLYARERRLFVALRGNELVAFAGVIPIYARKGWFVEDLIRAPDAPNGTVELLVDAAMRDAAELGSEYVTLGLAPLAGAVEFWLGAARKYGSALYDFAGLEAFKTKFRPREWSPIYLSYPRDESSYLALYASLVAFSRRGLFRYGVETLLRGPDIVIRVLAVLLIPWTLGLAAADTAFWFPSRAVQNAWIGFDVILCVALFALTLRRRPWLLNLLILLVSADTATTLVEALLFNVPRLDRWFEAIVLLIAVMAPSFALVVLRNARTRIARSRTS
jgi:phosphatidylglycerol lysyltransferase